MSGVYEVHESLATVGARVDIDGLYGRVVVDTNRSVGDGAAVVLEMTPKVARALARQLSKWAKLVEGVAR